MSDYISRQDVLDSIIASINQFGGRYTSEQLNMWGLFTQMIQEVPSADVVPMVFHDRCMEIEIKKRMSIERKKGEWEEIEVIADAYDISGVKTWASKMMCDQCGFTTIAIEGYFSQYNFCPNCGADMRGSNNDN